MAIADIDLDADDLQDAGPCCNAKLCSSEPCYAEDGKQLKANSRGLAGDLSIIAVVPMPCQRLRYQFLLPSGYFPSSP